MQLSMPAPAFYGAMNFSGDLQKWSFTDFEWPDQAEEVSRMVRFAGSDGSEVWTFWVTLPHKYITIILCQDMNEDSCTMILCTICACGTEQGIANGMKAV